MTLSSGHREIECVEEVQPIATPHGSQQPNVNRVRLAWKLAVLIGVLLPVGAWGFKQRFHETLTETLLRSEGFDEDSADESGDSNYWTDVSEPSTEAAHADNNRLGAASQRLRDKRTAIGDALNVCKRRDALDALGEALHTVQDIFSHSNAVDNGHRVDLLNLVDGTAVCNPANNFAPGGLVTGFFSLGGFFTGNQCRFKPADMCCHLQLNKDSPDEPNGARHPEALSQAGLASKEYLGLILDDIRRRFGDRAEQLINLLKRKQRTAIFVIDDTGSMSNDLAGVKLAANAFLDSVAAAGESPTLGLVTFKDDVTNRGTSCNSQSALRAQINGLFASGGGDCPEAMNSALLAGIDNVPTGRSDIQIQGGRLLLATDASARDPELGPVVSDQASIRGVSVDAILTGDCVAEEGLAAPTASGAEAVSENEPGAPGATPTVTEKAAMAAVAFNPLTSRSARTYLRALTEQTGGVLFNVARGEVDDVAPTLLSLSDPSTAIVLTRRVQGAVGSSTTVPVPLDESFRSPVTFMVTSSTSAGLPTFELRRPDGTLVQAGQPGVIRRVLSSVITFAIDSPAVGTWQATLTGGGAAVLRVFGPTSLRVNGVRYLVPGTIVPRPESDIGPLSGQPVAGARLLAEVRLTNGVGTTVVSLRRQDGTLLASPATTALDPRRFQATVTIPGEIFLLELAGRTIKGNPYLRQIPIAIVPRTVEIRATPILAEAGPGTEALVDLDVTNASGAPASYQLQVSSTLAWPRIVPGPFTIDAGATATVSLHVTVPAGTSTGTRNDLVVLVQDPSSPSARNSTAVAVVASSTNRPPVCTSAAPSSSLSWPPNHDLVKVSVLGITDPDGDPVTTTVTRITQDEPVSGQGSGDTSPDGAGVGTPTASIRSERAGSGDGRVYEISFRADDGKGGSCSGGVRVGVPHSQNGAAPVDSGQRFNSTASP